ncbi:MAG: flagellar hook-length control protein FliK [Ruminococcus sp.]|jgi:flagellar hook-length control protein FliK|nr:flagellar hook-length control protein FliK [Ruminococcus sp.]
MEIKSTSDVTQIGVTTSTLKSSVEQSGGSEFLGAVEAAVQKQTAVNSVSAADSTSPADTVSQMIQADRADRAIAAAVDVAKLLRETSPEILDTVTALVDENGVIDIGALPETAEGIADLLIGLGVNEDEAGTAAELLLSLKETGASTLEPIPDENERQINLTADLLSDIAYFLYPNLSTMTEEEFTAMVGEIQVTSDTSIRSENALVTFAENDSASILTLGEAADESFVISLPEKPLTDEIPTEKAVTTNQLLDVLKKLTEMNPDEIKVVQELVKNGNVTLAEAVKSMSGDIPEKETLVLPENLSADEKADVLETLSKIFAEKPNAKLPETGLTDLTIGKDALSETLFRSRVTVSYTENPETEQKPLNSQNPQQPASQIQAFNPSVTTGTVPTLNPVESEIIPEARPQAFWQNEIYSQVSVKLSETDFTKDGVQDMTMVLKPRDLGEVAIKVTSESGNVTIAMSATNASTQQSIAETAANLMQTLRNGGVNVREILVVEPSDAGAQMGLNFTGSGGFTGRSDADAQDSAAQYGGLPEEAEETETTPENFEQRRSTLWRQV